MLCDADADDVDGGDDVYGTFVKGGSKLDELSYIFDREF